MNRISERINKLEKYTSFVVLITLLFLIERSLHLDLGINKEVQIKVTVLSIIFVLSIFHYIRDYYIPKLRKQISDEFVEESTIDKFTRIGLTFFVICLASISIIILFNLVEGNYIQGEKLHITNEVKYTFYFLIFWSLIPYFFITLMMFFNIFADAVVIVIRVIFPILFILAFLFILYAWIILAIDVMSFMLPIVLASFFIILILNSLNK